MAVGLFHIILTCLDYTQIDNRIAEKTICPVGLTVLSGTIIHVWWFFVEFLLRL